MSPLRIEAKESFGLKVLSARAYEELEENPVKIIKKSGKERHIKTLYAINPDPELFRKFIRVSKGETVVIPDVPGDIVIDTDKEFKILRERSLKPLIPRKDEVFILVRVEGYGLTKDETGEEKPKLEEECTVETQQLKKEPVIVYTAGRETAKVSWSEK